MKKIIIICFSIFSMFFIASISSIAAEETKTAEESKPIEEPKQSPKKFDAKVCYKRCMDDVDDKATCEYICYNKRKY